MHQRDKIQDIIYDIDQIKEEGELCAFKAIALVNAVDPEDEYEVNHPMNVGEPAIISASGFNHDEAVKRLKRILRRWGFEGPIVPNYSEECNRIQEEKRKRAKEYKAKRKSKVNIEDIIGQLGNLSENQREQIRSAALTLSKERNRVD